VCESILERLASIDQASYMDNSGGMMTEAPKSPRQILYFLFLAMAPWLMGTRCLDQTTIDTYQDAVAANAGGGGSGGGDTGSDTGSDTETDTSSECVIPVVPEFGEAASVEEMAGYACLGDRCSSKLAVNYWLNYAGWSSSDIERTVSVDGSGSALSFTVTDKAGDGADLEFDVGKPVTLSIKNSEAADTHFLTAPKFYRSVAWRRVLTEHGEFKAHTFDSIGVKPGTNDTVKLTFVPMKAGTYTVFSENGVPDGDNYAGIIDGSVNPDLSQGDAGQGLKELSITVSENDALKGKTLVQESDADRNTALDADSRRQSSDDVWTTLNSFYQTEDVGVTGSGPIELRDSEDGPYSFNPSAVTLVKDSAYVLAFDNRGEATHVYTAPSFFSSAVMLKAEDDSVEVKAPYLDAVLLLAGKKSLVTLVPDRLGVFRPYCELSVTHFDGKPDLSTGHAVKGMVGTITVTSAP
jgi:hypothetical protein